MIIHVVRQGDTIRGIANMYGVSTERIISDNGLYNLPYLVVGQALIILIPQVVHVVTQGETIFSISNMYNINEIELFQKNPTLINNPVLYIGQFLVIRFENEGNRVINISGYVYPYINNNLFRRTLPFITECGLFGYGFRTDGSLITINDQPLINTCYQYSTVPIMVLSSITEDGNFSTERASLLFNDIQLQNRVLENMIGVMSQKGYLGIDIDFEFINSEDSDAFISFVENAAMRMHEYGYTVNVDLAPKTSSEQKGLLYEAHNYSALGNAADTVLVMTYEWGYTYGPPLPVAPLPNVRQVVEYAVTQIPRSKIMMGIPNYGYDWKLPYERGLTRATNLGNEEAVRLAATYGVPIRYDENEQSPYFEYFARDGSKHIVWFEDVRSIQAKFELITEFNLRGGGYWNLMRPFSSNWAFLSQQFNIRKTVV